MMSQTDDIERLNLEIENHNKLEIKRARRVISVQITRLFKSNFEKTEADRIQKIQERINAVSSVEEDKEEQEIETAITNPQKFENFKNGLMTSCKKFDVVIKELTACKKIPQKVITNTTTSLKSVQVSPSS